MSIEKKALFILPHHDFLDDEYFKVKDSLEDADVKTEVCSTHMSEAQGRFKSIINPQFLVTDARGHDYDIFIFVGGEGASELYNDVDVQNLVNDVVVSDKIMVLFGEAVMYLFYANVLDGKRVTTFEDLKPNIEDGGGYYTGTDTEQDGNIITGYDDKATDEVSKAIIRSLRWLEKA